MSEPMVLIFPRPGLEAGKRLILACLKNREAVRWCGGMREARYCRERMDMAALFSQGNGA